MPNLFMRAVKLPLVLFVASLVMGARAQVRPYIGFVYPAGGQQGATCQVKLGGQGIDDPVRVIFTGEGITARIVEFHRSLNPQETTLLNEQLRDLKRSTNNASADMMMSADPMMMSDVHAGGGQAPTGTNLAGKIQARLAAYVNRPACAALAHITYLEVTVDKDAPAGPREMRLVTGKGISNPMNFHVGQLPEFTRKAMGTAPFQVLGKEGLALRKRPPSEAEDQVLLPGTLNGQIASGEVNRYRFSARRGQHLVFSTQARQLIPYIADAVPGWFQPVLALYNSKGREVAYSDDYRFRPDPTILYEVPDDGEYVLAIYDAIYRGREDFVYRITAGELPFITSVFPLGARTNTEPTLKLTGWNLATDELPWADAVADAPGVHWVHATKGGFHSNLTPFTFDALPDEWEKEPNDKAAKAQKVKLPVIINGRIERKDDWDVFQFHGRSNQTVVVEVQARRLDSPLDAVVRITDTTGALVAFNDDCEDIGSGLNTHHADSYARVTLPKDGPYLVHLGDTDRNGGVEYCYRLRISSPMPDFELRMAPSSLALRGKGSAGVNVHAIRRDGFTGPIKLTLRDPPKGFSASPVTLTGTQTVARVNIKTDLLNTGSPVPLSIMGTAKAGNQEITRQAVPAEDRMQAFFWKHLVPAQTFQVLVYDPNYQPVVRRVPPTLPRPPWKQSQSWLPLMPPANQSSANNRSPADCANSSSCMRRAYCLTPSTARKWRNARLCNNRRCRAFKLGTGR